jgi:MYXO-CTERM domain-containing protein
MVRGLTGCTLVVASLLATPASARALADARGVAAATHPSRGVPSLLWASDSAAAPAGSTAEQAARHHLERLRDTYRVPRGALRDAPLLFVHDTGRGGIIVGLRQTVGGVDVHHGDIKVLLDRSHRLIAVSGTPHPAIHARSDFSTPAARAAATAVALRTLYGVDLTAHLAASREAPRAGFTYLDVAVPTPVDLEMRRPARVKPILFPEGDGLRPAHLVEIQAKLRGGRDQDAHAFIVDLDGRVLHRKNLVAHEAFQYRVHADADGRPLDSPLEDYNPHPQGEPVDGPVAPTFPTLVSTEGYNTNPDGVPDPWLPPGATETVGNNIDAYVDWNNPSGLFGSEFRGKITGLNQFDWVYDIGMEPLADQTQSMASITSIFYVTNWLHDWWYDSGFTESAGNAQTDNYGRGGVGGDVLRAEAQDAALEGARNNANMSTPMDGESPTMQMYLWSPATTTVSLSANPPDQDFPVGQAMFGPRKYNVSASLVLVDDGTDMPTVGCAPPVNDVDGKIVLVDRGGDCTFEVKANHVEAAGAVGVVFPDSLANMDEYPPGSDPDTVDPTIPAQGLSKADGQILKDALEDGPVTAHMMGDSSAERDGTLDNLIVAHEFGHYLHFRLSICGIPQCGAQSEGWGDFLALMMSLRDGDDLDGTYAGSFYGTFDSHGYFGLRRAAYSVDMTKNATSFRHIENGAELPPPPFFADNFIPNAEVHNAGEIWSTMMWEAYIALHKAHQGDLEFAEVNRRMSDYVVAGLMMAPPDPTYTEQRDGILAGAAAQDPDDFLTIAEAFARRGAGTCAVSPTKLDADFGGVVEDFEIRANGVLLSAGLDDSVDSCDDDGILDATETGKLSVKIRNVGVLPMVGATVTLSATGDSVVFAGGSQLAVPDLAPQAEVDLDVDISLVDDPPPLEDIVVNLALSTPQGCEAASELPLASRLNGDVALAVSAADDVDAPITPWVIAGTQENIWSRVPAEGGGYLWHGIDFGSVSDTWIESPTLDVSASDPLIITLRHAYSFEFTDDTAWDGGLIEVSTDGGMTWEDISAYVDPGYTSTINNPVNPIHMRPVFGGTSPDFPELKTLALDLGSSFSGQALKLRFRIGTDGFVSAPGWGIDDIAFEGITNTPFNKWVEDASCSSNPTTTGDSDSDSGTDPTPTDPTLDSCGESDCSPTGPGGSDADDPGPPLAEEPSACGCNATGPSGFLTLLGLLALPRRRRRA